MGRPRTPLPTDDQARAIQRGVLPLLEAHVGASDHKEFIRDFIELVLQATAGRLYGAQYYEKLLADYGVGRRPSRTTINAAVREFRLRGEDALRSGRAAGPASQASPQVREDQPRSRASARPRIAGTDMGDPDRTGIRALEAQLAAARDQNQQLQRETRELQTLAARHAARALQLEAERDAAANQAAAVSSQLSAIADALNKSTIATDGARNFALQAIDRARAETREQRDANQVLSAEIKRLQEQVDIYRRRVHDKGPA